LCSRATGDSPALPALNEDGTTDEGVSKSVIDFLGSANLPAPRTVEGEMGEEEEDGDGVDDDAGGGGGGVNAEGGSFRSAGTTVVDPVGVRVLGDGGFDGSRLDCCC